MRKIISRSFLVFVMLSVLLLSGCSNSFLKKSSALNYIEQKSSEINKSIQQSTAKENLKQQRKEVPSISTDKYVYQTLDETGKKVYDEILDAILNQEKEVLVSTTDKNTLDSSYDAVMSDYGGLFWVSGYGYTQYLKNEVVTDLSFSPKYTMDLATRQTTQAQIDVVVDSMLSGISISDSDYDKVKYVYKTLIETTDYDLLADNNQNIISVFLGKKTVCQGYACATQYLFNLLGMQSAIVSGEANGQSHAWNLVSLDHEYYYVDTTWGNSTFTDTNSQISKFVNYNYLNITTKELLTTHQITSTFLLPQCNATDDNYFLKENLYYMDWYPKEIGKLLKSAWESKQSNVSVKFADAGLYQKALDYFITQQHVADYCKNLKKFYYVEDKDQNILTFCFY